MLQRGAEGLRRGAEELQRSADFFLFLEIRYGGFQITKQLFGGLPEALASQK